jgi:AraC-like DNA-binding protein
MDLLETLRGAVQKRITTDGQHNTDFSGLCVHRYSKRTTFTKIPTLGVTLAVVLEGEKRVRFPQGELKVTPGQFLVFTRETEYLGAATSTPFLGLGLCFGPERVARALIALAEAGGPQTTEVMPAFVLPAEPLVAGALLRLWNAACDPVERQLLAPLAADEIVFRLLRSDAAATMRGGVGAAADSSRILDAMQLMRANLSRPLSITQIARQVAMSPSHFAHRFRAVARVTPARYARDARLDHARSLLLSSGARASDVAARTGFESPAHFSREFKRRFGEPPSSYLKKQVRHPSAG